MTSAKARCWWRSGPKVPVAASKPPLGWNAGKGRNPRQQKVSTTPHIRRQPIAPGGMLAAGQQASRPISDTHQQRAIAFATRGPLGVGRWPIGSHKRARRRTPSPPARRGRTLSARAFDALTRKKSEPRTTIRRGTGVEAPLIIAVGDNRAALCVPNVRHSQVGSGPPSGRGAARLDTRRLAAGEQETAPDLHGCQIRAVVAQSGWPDSSRRPLNPQEPALCATCENSHNRAHNLRSRRSFRVICANPCPHHVPNVSPRVPEDRWVPMVTQRQTHSPPGVRCYPVRPHRRHPTSAPPSRSCARSDRPRLSRRSELRRATLARWSPSSCSYRTAPASKSCQPVADGASVPCSVGDRVIRP